MKIIDFHAHIYPPKIAERAVAGIGGFYSVPMQGKGTPEDLAERNRNAGVSGCVVNSVATVPKQVAAINSFIAGVCREEPSFYGFATLHPALSAEEMRASIRQIEELGLHGVKLHPDTQGSALNSPEMMRIFEQIEGKLPVLIHCGDYRTDISHPKRLAEVLDTFPDLTVIAAHFGGWSIYDYALEYLSERRCYLDTSSSMMYTGPKRARELIRLYGADRIVYGTDYPMWDPQTELQRFLGLELTEEENEKILWKNAMRILRQTE